MGVYSIATTETSAPTYLRNMSFALDPVYDASIPLGYNAYDIKATTETNLATLELVLEMDNSGDIYQNGAAPDDPNVDFATFVTIGPSAANEPDTAILGAPPGEVEAFDGQNLRIAWAPEYGVDTGDGEFLIARIVFKADASGSWTLKGWQSGLTTIREEWFGSVELSGVILPGDVNGDGFVGSGDLSALISNWGLTGATRGQGDVTGDGKVGGADYNQVLSNWGAGTPPEPPSEAVPEPATLALLLIGGLLALVRRRK